MCEPAVLTNQMSKCTDQNNVGSKCAISCPEGTKMIGSSKRTCTRYGNSAQWDGGLPICQAMCDPAGTKMRNGILSCTDKHYLNSKCTATCDFKYKLSGSLEKNCEGRPNGQADWTMADFEPRCDPICQPLTVLANGIIECSSENNLGSDCAFTCNDRFQLRGHETASCIRNSTMENGVGWDNRVPMCEPICDPVPRIPHAVVSCTSATDLGSECTFVCEKGYELVGRESTTCLLNVNDGNVGWEHGMPYCQQMCTAPISIQHGHVNCEESSEGISIGNECVYTCNDGFRLVGNTSATCSVGTNGLTTWNNPPPFCERM